MIEWDSPMQEPEFGLFDRLKKLFGDGPQPEPDEESA